MSAVEKEVVCQKFLTKRLLKAVVADGKRLDFNRQLDAQTLRHVTNDRMPVQFCMMHEHAGGIRVEPHARCFVTMATALEREPFTVILDMTFERYDNLPSVEL